MNIKPPRVFSPDPVIFTKVPLHTTEMKRKTLKINDLQSLRQNEIHYLQLKCIGRQS